MSSRYVVAEPLSAERLSRFVAIDNLTAQVPLVEIVQKKERHIRIWVAYDYQRVCGTYLEVHTNGLVITTTVYPSGRKHEKVVRNPDQVLRKRARRNVGKGKRDRHAKVYGKARLTVAK